MHKGAIGMTFTVFDVFAWTIVYLNFFVVARIIVNQKSFHIKEGIFIIASSIFIAILAVVGIAIFDVGGALSGIMSLLLGMLYIYKIKAYSITKSIILVFVSVFILTMSDVFAMLTVSFFFSYFLPSIPNFPSPIGLYFYDFLRYMPYVLFLISISALTGLLFTILTKKQRRLINQSDTAQAVLAGISLIIIAVMIIVTGIWRNLGSTIEFITWTIVPVSGIAVATLAGVILYARTLHEQMARQQKESEQEILQQYTTQIEQQQGIVSKMQHDIGNILSSMEGYLQEDDLAGAKEYFYAKIKMATADITDNSLALARLANIKVPEIKATLAAKLAVAQSAGIDINFEANDIVDYIPVNSVALVRMLGIIMDNAIEELTGLGSGQLMVACYVIEGGVTFVVQNTCRQDIQKLHVLEQIGFSTKGNKRGLGLSNLAEIAAAYPDNIALYTSIEGGNFTQKLRIGGTV